MSIKEAKNQPQPFDLPTELLRLENKRAEIKAEQGGVSKALTFLENLQKQETDILRPIQDKVKTGEVSTGNKIKDFVLVWLNGSEKYEEQICNLENQLKKHQGEFVLVKRVKSEQNKLLDEKPHWVENFRLGVIKNNEPFEINMEQAELKISSNNSLSIKKDNQGNTPYETSMPVLIHNWELTEFDKTVEEANRPNLIISRMFDSEIKSFIETKGNKDFVIEIFIGDKQVFEVLKNKSLLNSFPLLRKIEGMKSKL
ncbi:hypothetical protein MUP35_03855 [Patescibacteria group bacterium]|nr:hypothetical protein [Patescibacteria group bacterium]